MGPVLCARSEVWDASLLGMTFGNDTNETLHNISFDLGNHAFIGKCSLDFPTLEAEFALAVPPKVPSCRAYLQP